jgi:hypothetical protein
MLLIYFVVDSSGQIRRVPRGDLEAVWRGECRSADLAWELADELRIVSVLCDEDNLSPLMCFFAWTELRDGWITDESRCLAYDAMGDRHEPANGRAANRQLVGWPDDWQHQLAVALDVPTSQLRRVGVGGPFIMSDLWGITVEKVLEYFEDACEELD